MKKNIFIKIVFATLALIILLSIGYITKATFNPGDYSPGTVNKEDAKTLFSMGEEVFGALKDIAAVVAVVTLAIIGLKYMFGSVDQKAEYKTTMIPWIVGALLVVTITSFIDIIQNLASKI